MPLKKCSENGWKWGDEGKCYTGRDAKKQAIKQGIAIEGPKKFSQMAYDQGFELSEAEIEYVIECGYQQGMSFSDGMACGAMLALADGFTEEINESNFYIPKDSEYLESDCNCDDDEEWDWANNRPGLWENIRRKKLREGKNYKPAKTVKEGRPTQEQLKRAQSKELQRDVYDNPGEAMKRAKELGLDGIHDHPSKKDPEKKVYMPGKTHDAYEKKLREEMSKAEVECYADHAEALQRGKPGPNDPRKTPAPKKDQKKGSKKNKPDSAKDDKGKITFSQKTIDRLKSKMAEHNKKGKGSKASLGALKAVYRRGAGAYSTSHAPKMSRDGWAMARVNAFLYLLRNGRPSNPNYKQDNDLLPSSHPRSSKAAMTEKQKEALDKNKDGKITKEDFELLRKTKGSYAYKDPFTGETYYFERRGVYTKNGRRLVRAEEHSEGYGLPKKIVEKELKKQHADWHKPGASPPSKFKAKKKKDEKEHTSFVRKNQVTAPPTMTWQDAAVKDGKKVKLNKPFRTPDGPKKFSVYVKNEKGNVVKVNFGDPNMEIKRDDPKRRKSFRARHNCSNPGPKWKARYWSCWQWRASSPVKG
tara:strand:+ start:12119 stop:13876 length:1758 start_codon:yes stop_codon:yes gene_type:complete